ncbi:bifunctional hydroxymethylpyrimidine kinase/phosphomethylpyrimidine kinase [Myxococcota bacterium]|nr:bifunctional hydroxymethylpyrimidine kinase/phosphomethylpyrimidine kinase [Myxococcota bacterium]
MNPIARALTIAGSDCSGGAGIQADLKTFHRFGVFGQSAVTAVVAENTRGVQGWHRVDPAMVRRQIDSCLQDIGADAVKTGMLVDREVVESVAGGLRHHGVRRLVVDPVMRAKGGDALIDPEAVDALVREVLPLALVVTPNVPEAEVLAGRMLDGPDAVRRAAEAIRAMGPRYVVLKGGHARFGDPSLSVDLLWDGTDLLELPGPRMSDRNTHGTGCTYSAAIAAWLARGLGVVDAVRRSRAFLIEAIRSAPGLGGGHGPVNHWAALPEDDQPADPSPSR